jgi:hypothetical protein
MPASIEMTRQELYNLVWSKPMRDAAATIPTMVPPHRIGLPGVHGRGPSVRSRSQLDDQGRGQYCLPA